MAGSNVTENWFGWSQLRCAFGASTGLAAESGCAQLPWDYPSRCQDRNLCQEDIACGRCGGMWREVSALESLGDQSSRQQDPADCAEKLQLGELKLWLGQLALRQETPLRAEGYARVLWRVFDLIAAPPGTQGIRTLGVAAPEHELRQLLREHGEQRTDSEEGHTSKMAALPARKLTVHDDKVLQILSEIAADAQPGCAFLAAHCSGEILASSVKLRTEPQVGRAALDMTCEEMASFLRRGVVFERSHSGRSVVIYPATPLSKVQTWRVDLPSTDTTSKRDPVQPAALGSGCEKQPAIAPPASRTRTASHLVPAAEIIESRRESVTRDSFSLRSTSHPTSTASSLTSESDLKGELPLRTASRPMSTTSSLTSEVETIAELPVHSDLGGSSPLQLQPSQEPTLMQPARGPASSDNFATPDAPGLQATGAEVVKSSASPYSMEALTQGASDALDRFSKALQSLFVDPRAQGLLGNACCASGNPVPQCQGLPLPPRSGCECPAKREEITYDVRHRSRMFNMVGVEPEPPFF
eukprot:TRINITY_DN71822_c0_g1_i1.p1 TRINITY_DN71822_c0_g1~~TRINITY_DN71822_c0_g1_i1.p1  ORF type:complete len:528 (-),score=55.71 TRINITY_DN71822_c0_g1_i1:74-1657(-)